jgi:glutamine amidotransferase
VIRVAVLDAGLGNLRSVAKALERVGARVDVTAEVPERAEALVVPGQGAFGALVARLGPRRERVVSWIAAGRPYLGICLGLQVLFEASEEGGGQGLGVLPGKVVRFPPSVRVPHIGWNEVRPAGASPLFAGVEPGTRFYFCHSYYPEAPAEVVAATSEHGVTFCCAVSRGALHAVQFHPEKSGEAGLALLSRFVEEVRAA